MYFYFTCLNVFIICIFCHRRVYFAQLRFSYKILHPEKFKYMSYSTPSDLTSLTQDPNSHRLIVEVKGGGAE